MESSYILVIEDDDIVARTIERSLRGDEFRVLLTNSGVEGLKAAPVKKPIAVRMIGTNEQEGQDILRQNGIGYYPDMEQAAAAIIKA